VATIPSLNIGITKTPILKFTHGIRNVLFHMHTKFVGFKVLPGEIKRKVHRDIIRLEDQQNSSIQINLRTCAEDVSGPIIVYYLD